MDKFLKREVSYKKNYVRKSIKKKKEIEQH